MVLVEVGLGEAETLMREFNSLGAFAKHILTRQVATVVALQAATERIGAHVEKVAKAEFGHYQSAIGPFPAWEELAESTKDDRVRQGYTENDPLLRSGDLRDSISHHSEPLEAVIGSPDPVLGYQEFGTSKIPPRPVLGPAARKSKEFIEGVVGVALVEGFVGEKLIHPALEYDFQTKA